MLNTDVILNNIALANKLASQYASQQPRSRDDIVSAAYWGLVKAAKRERANRTYVTRLVRGEIQNALHAGGSLTRSERQFLAEYLDHAGNMADRADAMGLSHERVFHRLAGMTFVYPLFGYANQLATEPEGNLEELIEVCLTYLPDQLHWTFLFQYRDQLSRREIGRRTGLGQRTIRRLQRRAINILRANKQEIADLVF